MLTRTAECLEAIFEGRPCECNNCTHIMEKLLGDNPMKDVNKSPHYQSECGMEAIDVIEAFDLGFNLGNVVKYVLRAGRKDNEKKDLAKALWYLKREISLAESQEEIRKR